MTRRLFYAGSGFILAVTLNSLAFFGTARAAGLTVTPPAVSNTYSGVITLNITGLTNTEQVVIEKYLDLNGNGVVDPGEALIDTFTISESGVSTIGGITNLNVPFDSNPATNAITTTLSFAPPIESVVGQHIFRLVSPTGNFAPQTALFNVTNAALAQSISGTVFNGVTPVPNALVVALEMPNQSFASSVVADNAGNYTLALNPGTYGLIPVLPGYFTDQSLGAMVTLTNGMSATNNLFLTNGMASNTISGQIYDAANSNGLGGVFVQVEADNLFGVAFTDTNGNYSAAVSPASNWKVKIESSRLPRRGYPAPSNGQQADTTAGSVSNVNFALPKGNAMYYGRLADGSNSPMANVDVFASDNPQQYKADGFTDANGNYSVAVLSAGNLWNCFPDSGNSAALNNFIVSSGLNLTNIAAGQALLQNFTALPATARITGHLQDNNGQSITNIGVSGNAVINSIQYNTFVDTDGSGNYSMPVASGFWTLFVNCCGNDGLGNLNLVDLVSHTVAIPPTNAVLNLTVYPIGTPVLGQPSRLGPSSVGFSLNGATGTNYTVQFSTNLASTNWTTLVITNLPSNGVFIQDNQATNGQRFYRAFK